ncbi:transposase [Chroococcus sp. FPU101]|uniref:transposase n=1 Tax=Chroococcus sp. FPU101 TaxID=1974212 RepID=UPI001A8E9E30|nr:transposase [Chroococcus sp. FPU101]GFE71916.1 hypothetical protein CFPU101_45260 [Chroococcus sp. FPU101]
MIQEVKEEDLIFIDETGVNLALTRTAEGSRPADCRLLKSASGSAYARSKKGTRAISSRPYPKGNNITLIGAIAKSGFLGALTFDGGTDQNVFHVFIEQILVPSLWPGAVVVMDNLYQFSKVLQEIKLRKYSSTPLKIEWFFERQN